MADKEIKITFPEERLEALAFFLAEKGETVEKMMKAHLEKTYEKSVPEPVKKFIDSRQNAAEEEAGQTARPQRQAREQRQTREQGRRSARQSARQEASGQQETSEREEVQEAAETTAESPDLQSEEAPAMNMGM